MRKEAGGITTYYPSDLYDVSGATSTKYIFDNTGGLLATVETAATSTTHFSHPDHLGSTNVVTDTTGEVAQFLDYYPFGSTRIDTGSDVSARQYIGEVFDQETDLSYLNARYYEGGRGQFLSQDPVFWEVGQTKDGRVMLLNPQLQNSYSYAQNNPIVVKDPTGRFAIGIGGDIGGNIPGIYTGGSVHLVMAGTNLSNIEFGIVASGEGGMTSAVLSGGLNVGGMFSPNAKSISDLEGLDIGGGTTVVFGPGAGPEVDIGVSVSANTNGLNGRKVKTYKGSVGVGVLATPYVVPVSVHGGASYSKSVGKVSASQVKSSYQAQLDSIASQLKQIQKRLNKLMKSKSKK